MCGSDTSTEPAATKDTACGPDREPPRARCYRCKAYDHKVKDCMEPQAAQTWPIKTRPDGKSGSWKSKGENDHGKGKGHHGGKSKGGQSGGKGMKGVRGRDHYDRVPQPLAW